METGTLLILMTSATIVPAFLSSNNKFFISVNKKNIASAPVKNKKEQSKAQAIKILNSYFF
jgi:hypothetical protein